MIVFLLVFLLTGCTKQLVVEKTNDKGKKTKTVVRYIKGKNATGQSLTENIICKPTEKELIKVYKDNKVYTRQCSNNVNPKNYDREENKGLTRLYQEKGQEDFEKYFLTNLILEGNVEILSGCNNTLRRLNYLANLLWQNKEFIKLRNKEDEIFTKSLNTKTEEEKNNIQIEYNNIKEDIKNHVSSFYDNHTRLNKNIERGR